MPRRPTILHPTFGPRRRPGLQRRGAAAILAMMFLVIFGALATAMAIVAQGNLSTADAHLKINRTLAASETGLNYLVYHLNKIALNTKITQGQVTPAKAQEIWDSVRAELITELAGATHNLAEPVESGATLTIGPIALEPFTLPVGYHAGDPLPGVLTFTATIKPHPLAGENYDSAYYQRSPYNDVTQFNPVVSSTHPLDARWLRVRVEAREGPEGHQVTRAIQMDFKVEKKVRYAILSRNRVMIGQHVMIEGPIGSRFMDVNLPNGHPVQMESDFRGLAGALDTKLDQFVNTLAVNDMNGDNRIDLSDSREVDGIANAAQYDKDHDGYITDYDFFLAQYDTAAKGYVTAADLDTANNVNTRQLLQLIDTFGDPTRTGYNDGVIDSNDQYVKVRGQIQIRAAQADWQAGAAGGPYQTYFQGPIVTDDGSSPLEFNASDTDLYSYSPADFDTSSLKNVATGSLAAQATAQAAQYDPNNANSPQPLGATVFESVPYGSAHPYDYYTRPVYKNMTFTNVTIPKGTNALFVNCKFVGCTYVETTTGNTDANYNYAGMQEVDQSKKYPSMTATVNGAQVTDTKTISNNLRFDGCTFEGAITGDVPSQFTQARNKLSFTGQTKFDAEDSPSLSEDEKDLYRRSTILAPQYSVELGTYVDPTNPNETVNLSGTIVAGVIDMRGQIKVDGSILTTFEPQNNVAPVIGQTSPQFNTTLGYFSSAQGDLEAEMPNSGLGLIQVRYDPTIPMPDGILAPVSFTALYPTYTETGAQ